MAQGFTNVLENNLLNFIFRTQASFIAKPTDIAIALCTGDPGEVGTSISNEVPNSNGYARVDLGAPADATWTAPVQFGDGRRVVNVNKLAFPFASGVWGTITHVAICDNSAWGGGNVLFAQTLNLPVTINSGTIPSFNPQTLTVTVD